MKAGSVALPNIGGATFFGANGSCGPQERNRRIPIEQRHVAMKKRGRAGVVFARPCCTMRRTESAVFAHVFRFLWLRCRFDLKPVAGMTAWNEKCGRNSIRIPLRPVKATVLRTEEGIP